jgi:hypothetical protein
MNPFDVDAWFIRAINFPPALKVPSNKKSIRLKQSRRWQRGKKNQPGL